MLQIIIKSKTGSRILDLAPNTVLELDSPTDAFDEDLTASDFSLPITVPWTENNRQILGFAERITNYNTATNYFECDVYDNGFPEILGGKFFLLTKAGALNYSTGSFSANITGARGLFGSRVKDKKLADINFGNPLILPPLTDSRQFATAVSKGLYPQLNYLAFAPVVIEGFFNENSAEFNGEFLAQDTVNNLVATNTGPTDWEFGRQSPTSSTTALMPGTDEYIDYRTIPFFQLKWVLKKVLEQMGYQVQGGIVDDEALDNLYLFNNFAIEKYDVINKLDLNKTITITNHLPDMLVTEFLRRCFMFFNVYPSFSSGNKIILKQRNAFLKNRVYTDVTQRAISTFTSTYREDGETRGYILDYEHDAEDGYFGEHVKEIEGKKLVATVNLASELGALSLPFTLDTNSLAYVQAENMYYNVADATTIPATWEVYGENLLPQTVGDGGRQVSLGMDTLATHVIEVAGLQTRLNKLASRQAGSYITNRGSAVVSPFGLRVFYIRNLVSDGKQWPVSHNHNTAPDGTEVETNSLAIYPPKGLLALHKAWQNIKDGIETATLTLQNDRRLQTDLQQSNMLMLSNIALIPTNRRYSIPAGNVMEVDVLAVG